MSPAPTVVKVGGNEIDDPRWVSALVEALAGVGGPLILVHGGGKEISELQRALGVEPQWHDGLRVTTPETLRAVAMVLSGAVNKRLVAALVGAGVRAVGISGEDAGTLLAAPVADGRMGRTGAIHAVDTRLLDTLLAAGMLPVLSPVSRGDDGGALNVNADDAAAAVAGAVGAARLLFLSNVPGVLQGGAPLAEVGAAEVETLIADGVAAGGMAPKLRAAARAAGSGVSEVRIGALSMLAQAGTGTRVLGTSDSRDGP